MRTHPLALRLGTFQLLGQSFIARRASLERLLCHDKEFLDLQDKAQQASVQRWRQQSLPPPTKLPTAARSMVSIHI